MLVLARKPYRAPRVPTRRRVHALPKVVAVGQPLAGRSVDAVAVTAPRAPSERIRPAPEVGPKLLALLRDPAGAGSATIRGAGPIQAPADPGAEALDARPVVAAS